MNFVEAMKNETKWTRTENGAVALNTTGTACLDLFGTIGALRKADEARITSLFEEAYQENPLLATKILFYARDIRGDKETTGLGERRVFRIILKYAALHHPECIRPNLDLIGIYGRYDDLYELIYDDWRSITEMDYAVFGGQLVILVKTVKQLYDECRRMPGSIDMKNQVERLGMNYSALYELNSDIVNFCIKMPKNQEMKQTKSKSVF